ncbi:heme NO-binding domain-containing protein [uncultured Jannaschia sp.]|uniref:heme NO-binding domain-containing protein n=1 Tax=uncultured Jannaschia sp. TaxID=293347 RepID=UPI00262902D8|nr:heme NO-binding domain-containing protein [uncultured Jannaschia sp.]
MHGLICKTLEEFVIDQHGPQIWSQIRRDADAPYGRFEALRNYDAALMLRLMDASGERLNRPIMVIFEDIGHWICTHPPLEQVRRLIRFSGRTFVDLLYSLDELHDRARMALPGIDLPHFEIAEPDPGIFHVTSRWSFPGAGAVLTGSLRAMADDYGALVLIDADRSRPKGDGWTDQVTVQVIEHAFHAPREFTLGGVT